MGPRCGLTLSHDIHSFADLTLVSAGAVVASWPAACTPVPSACPAVTASLTSLGTGGGAPSPTLLGPSVAPTISREDDGQQACMQTCVTRRKLHGGEIRKAWGKSRSYMRAGGNVLGLPRPLFVAIAAYVKGRFVLNGDLRTQSARRIGLDNLAVLRWENLKRCAGHLAKQQIYIQPLLTILTDDWLLLGAGILSSHSLRPLTHPPRPGVGGGARQKVSLPAVDSQEPTQSYVPTNPLPMYSGTLPYNYQDHVVLFVHARL